MLPSFSRRPSPARRALQLLLVRVSSVAAQSCAAPPVGVTEYELTQKWPAGNMSYVLRFAMPPSDPSLGLRGVKAFLDATDEAGEPATLEKSYSPVSLPTAEGHFDLLVKVYPQGAVSGHLAALPLGRALEVKHIPVNVKIQYPFGSRKVVMIAGGTGITPMLQALHALLGNGSDTSAVHLLYSSRDAGDILAKPTLDAWAGRFATRLHVTHTLTREPAGSGWAGRRGRIDRALLEETLPPPAASVLIFVCGPDAMYRSFAGARRGYVFKSGDQGLGYYLDAEASIRDLSIDDLNALRASAVEAVDEDAKLLDELKASGGDLRKLAGLARTGDRSALTNELKKLGYKGLRTRQALEAQLKKWRPPGR